MNNYKTFFKIQLLISLFSFGFARAQTISTVNKQPIVTRITGPTGQLVAASAIAVQPQTLSCVVNGITITTSGTDNYSYVTPPAQNSSCNPTADFTGLGNWTGTTNAGNIVYTFSPAVLAARVSYFAVNTNDVGTLTSNSTTTTQLTELCGVTGSGAILSCNFANSFGNVGVTVTSQTPFTTITLTNTGGQSGWVNGDPCKFIVTPLPPSPTIVNCPKLYLGERCYRATGTGSAQSTPFSVFNTASNGSANSGCTLATINGVPCTASNVTIEAVTPLPSGCIFNLNGDGTILIAPGTLPFNTNGQFFYRFRSISNPNIYSSTYRADFGITNRVTISGKTIQLNGNNPVYNGTTSILTGCFVQISPNGFCNSSPASTTNVTFSDFTSPPNLYYTINAAGFVVLRPAYINNILATVPPPPYGSYTLNYSMCVAGSSLFCNTTGTVGIFYTYPLNRTTSTTTTLESIKIVPNPSTDGVFTVIFDGIIKNSTIEVFNAMGLKMYSQEVNDTNEQLLVLDTLPKGNYVLKISGGSTTINKHIVKL